MFKLGVFSNLAVWIAFLIGFSLLNFVLITGLFDVADLENAQYLTIYGLSLCSLIIIQLEKIFFGGVTEKDAQS